MQTLRLKPRCDRRIRQGHLWVYSNEVDVAHCPLRQHEAGEVALLEDSRGKPLGLAYVNPNTLICARILTRKPTQPIGGAWLQQRLRHALSLREQLFAQPFYRLVYGEADGLPGLVVDRFGDVLALQANTAGMERLLGDILDALEQLLQPRAIVLRNDSPMRELEGLPAVVAVARGELPDAVLIEENQTRFVVPVMEGQKTGWFYDHRLNRRAVRELAEGRRVLDVFSYIGGWGIQAATAGASAVTLVDSSPRALELAQENARINHCGERCETIAGKAQQVMKDMAESGRRFDLVILDPPAFIKRKKDAAAGEQGYRRINELAMRLLEPGGFLLSASCSMHFPRERLMETLAASASHIERRVAVLSCGSQGPDHPVHPAIPETDYLKAALCRVDAPG